MENTRDNQQPGIPQGVTVHELRTHLTAIIAAADLLAEQIEPHLDDTSRRLIGAISRNARSMNEKLYRLSDVHGYVDRPGSPQDSMALADITRRVANLMAPLFHNRMQNLVVEVAADIPPVNANAQYIEYVLLTLLHNASKFTPSKGRITVDARSGDGSAVIEVRDTGIGIPPEVQAHVFQPHHRLLAGHPDEAGTGTGLAMAKFLVELHGGKMWLKSDVGKGSSFFFTLPCGKNAGGKGNNESPRHR